jgi:hypothetical protein
MQLFVTRDSVCAGDDGDAPHPRTFPCPAALPPEQAVATVLAASYLPSIAGGQATWVASSAVPLAVIAQQWPAPRPLPLSARDRQRLDRRGDQLRLHFSYFAQEDPAQVLALLARLRLYADP